MAVQIDGEKCTGCGLCVDACPVEAISLENDKAKVDAEKCVDCGQCVEECPNEVIRMP
ncbi:MAG: 4Fe-4S binding protein [Verrucomicrobia bacterium]|nr:4Fe-4S binding protein [Verrucomicrobiota bacterium]MBU1734619.1 4Fe-4S binding protein [Verrucomicrobiota bacterium]MBU1856602.1 4Fe-4S binding protein [Verrucomicrobiota bacterium]